MFAKAETNTVSRYKLILIMSVNVVALQSPAAISEAEKTMALISI